MQVSRGGNVYSNVHAMVLISTEWYSLVLLVNHSYSLVLIETLS